MAGQMTKRASNKKWLFPMVDCLPNRILQPEAEPRSNNDRREKKKIGFSPLSYLFSLGVLSIALLNFVHLHRSEPSLDVHHHHSSSSRSPTTRGFAVSRHARAQPPPEVSACLIVMDDNHFLIEWLAYHYQTANLRHLIITSDPHSQTSPSKVLDRWRKRIKIQEWNETNFLPSDFEEKVKDQSFGVEKLEVLNNYLVRQAHFNKECLKELKRQNRGWTLMIDTDEYLIPREEPSVANQTKTVTPTISDLLANLRIPPGFEKIYSPCLIINRQQFSAGESPDEKVQAMVAPGFDGRDFQTMRWRHYGFEMEWYENKLNEKECGIARDIPNKVMIDLNRVTLEEFESEDHLGNPHKPLAMCPENIYANMRETPFVVHHYMGTPEQWFYRSNDKRGIGYRKARYEDMNERFGKNESDAIRPWLGSFVETVGSAEASRLLEGVGKVKPLPKAREVSNTSDTGGSVAKYKIGDIVEANFGGEGDWYPAEIYAAYSDNYYSVFFEDCTQEIATYDERLRPPRTQIAPRESKDDDSGDDDDA